MPFQMQPNSTVISAEVLAQAVAVEHQHVLNLQEQEKALEAAFQSTMSSSQQQQLRLQQVRLYLIQWRGGEGRGGEGRENTLSSTLLCECP